ncbi:DUF257 family protein [Thermococcus sp. P6]|uniref:DUF257 family protein n=1 Tax=Thermococcus sp. P6 TaxID=122420 RepID=UPI001E311EAA|nr:DUF257 family protein [Thermococcus sp. P6]
MDNVLSGIRPGESVLVEHSPVASPEILLYVLMEEYLKAGNYIIIDDIADTFREYVTRLELMGLNTGHLMEIPVIKIGGRHNFGNVVGRVDVEKYSLNFDYYREAYEKVAPETVVFNPVLGIHRLFMAFGRNESIRLIRTISNFVGDKSRLAFYFINGEVVERRSPDLLPLLEEIFTTVLRWELIEGEYRVKVVKSTSPATLGSVISVDFKDLVALKSMQRD